MTRRIVAIVLAVLVAGATVYAFLPFPGLAGISCGSAIVEAWPEPDVEGGWTAYVPDTEEATQSLTDMGGAFADSACGAEARDRIFLPLLGVAAVGLVLTGLRLRRALATPDA